MDCYDDHTEPKNSTAGICRLQEQYGELVRDLFTEDPKRVILKLLNDSGNYLTELAALNAHHASVRLRAIALLEKSSASILQRILEKEPDSEFGLAAKSRLGQIGG
ncbi:hypothetical protein ACH5Y9_22185 [Methylomonas sp. BW4-1]|uniref:hypothetical protein n=1 Tax=Methylomonas sp. BW4-1 TaxID=3376685 RepID=UPI004040EAC4